MIPLALVILASLGLRAVGFGGVDALDGWQPDLRGGLAVMLLVPPAPTSLPAGPS